MLSGEKLNAMALLTLLYWIGLSLLGLSLLILFILYIRGIFRDRIEYQINNIPSPEEPRFPYALASLSNSLTSFGIVTDIWSEPDKIQKARLEAIQSAQRSIHFETFLITPGRRANDFAAAVAERAAAGVRVQLLVDSYGASDMPKKYWRRLRAAGVEIITFNPFSWKSPSSYAGRTHRKLLLIDGQFVLMGGAGISDYWDGVPSFGDTQPWFDVEFRLEGAVVATLEGIFMQHWSAFHGLADLRREIFDPQPSNKPLILVTPGHDPTYRSSSMRALFQTSILAARKRVWLSSPYFIPDPGSRRLLIATKKRGVDVRIITDGICTDKKFVHYASYELYGELLAAGIEILEHQPSMVHAKLLLIDDCWARTGSANFDPRSFFHNDELDFSTSEPRFVQHIEQIFEQAFQRCQPVSLSEWRTRSRRQRLVGGLVRFIQWQL